MFVSSLTLRRNRRDPHMRRAFTLLELMLALSLTVIILLIINMAVDVHLRSRHDRTSQLEEAQLARSLLRMIANDLRGTVVHYEQDMSSIQALLQQTASSAVQGAVSSAGASGGSSSGSESGGQSSSGASSESSGSSEGSMSASSLSSTLGSMAASGALSSSGLEGEESANTADLSTTTIPSTPGLFGNQYQLQVDVSRLPRMENYQQYLSPDAATTVMDVPSDVKTVTYFVQNAPVASAGTNLIGDLAGLSDPSQSVGLVRRELDRSVTLWAMSNGNYSGLQNTGDVVAPEVVAIEFQYFDGVEWVLEWDTEVQQRLPIAVLVVLAIRPPGADASLESGPIDLASEEASSLHIYRMLVSIPAGGESAAATDPALTEGTSESSSSASSTGTVP